MFHEHCPNTSPFQHESDNVRPSPLMSQKTRPLSHKIQKGQDIIDERDTRPSPLPPFCGAQLRRAIVLK